MIESILKSIENSFLNFSLRRFFFLLTIFTITFGGIYVFETYTKYGFYSRLDNKTALLERLQEIEKKGFDSDSTLKTVYDNILSELKSSNSKIGILSEPYNFFKSDTGLKVLSSLIVSILLLISGLLTSEKSEIPEFVVGIFIFAIICLTIGILIPTFDIIWINFTVNIIISIVFITVVTVVYNED